MGEACSCIYIFTEGYYIISVLPENEIILERDSSLRVMGIMEILVFIVLFTVIFLLVKSLVPDNLGKVNSSLSRITEGDLDEVVDVRSNAEFSDLSDDINFTVGTLKQYIAAAAARIDEELAFLPVMRWVCNHIHARTGRMGQGPRSLPVRAWMIWIMAICCTDSHTGY